MNKPYNYVVTNNQTIGNIMTDFITFRDAVNAQINKMEKFDVGLLLTDADKKDIWDVYLNSFPAGTNPMYLTNTVHDCNCCKDFIRDLGRVVTIDDNHNIVTCWDININDDTYQVVADALSSYVKARAIESIYKSSSLSLHVKDNKALLPGVGGVLITHDHFYYKLGTRYTSTINRGEEMGQSKTQYNVLKRGLTELSVDALETVIDLINDNNLYLGEQNLQRINKFLQLKKEFDAIDDSKKELFVWSKINNHVSIVMFRNSVIGSLVVDISEGVTVDGAVASYETKVAPDNYKRSKSIITPKMIVDAQKTIAALGMENSLHRRHASLSDITINNVIWADGKTSAKLNNDVFDDLLAEAVSHKKPTNGTQISLLDFIDTVVPTAKSVEIYLEGKHNNSLVSLVSPVHPDAPKMMKWDNNFSWSYNGNVTDSIKERVKNKGGNVEGDLRVSLSWFNKDDLDIHMKCPPGNREINFMNKHSSGLSLDVDENVNSTRAITNPVENISATNHHKMVEGDYTVLVNNFAKRNTENAGFEIEVEYLGEVTTFSSDVSPRSGDTTTCFTFNYTHSKGLVIKDTRLNITGTSKSTELWGLDTNKYHNVSSIMWSPNHWDDNSQGNRHLFFMLNDCNNPEPVRGFYNEYLIDSLHNNRKVFEVLASKMKADPTDNQLSGLGFSTTKRGDAFIALVKTNNGNKLFNVVL